MKLMIRQMSRWSTESAVLKVYNDLLLAADSALVSALCLLDLTAAFDTVTRSFSLSPSSASVWFSWCRTPVVPILSDRSFRVVLGTSTSFLVHLFCSVPQGSVLGPRMFILYMADLADLVAKHQVNFHPFADDSQIYLHCRIGEASSAVSKLEDCISVIGHWMSANRPKLNADKMELLWVGSRHNLASL